jgi:hypothetical protein
MAFTARDSISKNSDKEGAAAQGGLISNLRMSLKTGELGKPVSRWQVAGPPGLYCLLSRSPGNKSKWKVID